MPLTLEGTVPTALDEPAKAAADGGPDEGGVGVLLVGLPADDGADRGVVVVAAAVGDLALVGGMPKRAMAVSAVSLVGAGALGGTTLLVALPVAGGKLPVLAKGEGKAAGEGAVGDGKAAVELVAEVPAFMGSNPAKGSAGSYRGRPWAG